MADRTLAFLMRHTIAAGPCCAVLWVRPVRRRFHEPQGTAGNRLPMIGRLSRIACRYPGAEVPKHLAEADLPGTYGFDPLRLGTNPDNLKWCASCRCAAGQRQAQPGNLQINNIVQIQSRNVMACRYAEAEKTNGRWAMAACAGILFTDAMGLPNWVNAGAEVRSCT